MEEKQMKPFLKITENLPLPPKGETLGEELELIITSFNPTRHTTDFGDKWYVDAIIAGVEYKWSASTAQTKSILSAGLTPNMLPAKGTIRTYKGLKQAQPSINVRFDNGKPRPNKELDDLLKEYETTSQPVQPQIIQAFQPHLVPTRDYEKENKERQEQIIRGMAFNAGIQLYLARKAKDKETIEQKSLMAYNAFKAFSKELKKHEEIIKGLDFPFDESDMDQIDEIFGGK